MRILDLLRTRRIAARSFLCCAAIAFQWASIPAASAAEVTGLSEDGDALRAYPVNGVPLLDSFLLQFSDNDDHNVQALTVWPGSPIPGSCLDCGQVTPGSIFLSLRDDDSREPFFFQVSHVDVPVGVRQRISAVCVVTCRLPLDKPARDSVFVLVGFSFNFMGVDHEIQRIGLWEENGEMVVHYRDETGDDQFRIDAEFVFLPPAMVPKRGNVSGIKASEAATVTVNLGPVASGPTVIRGFDFVFRPELDFGVVHNEEIRKIGIRTPGNMIEVICADNENDLFDWGVDWGALKIPVLDPPRG